MRSPKSEHSFKPIETRYLGYRFRSRNEARWAIVLQAMGLDWAFEDQGYLIDGEPYLVDFTLPSLRIHIEIKPKDPTPDEVRKARLLREASGWDVLILAGRPWPRSYRVLPGWDDDDSYPRSQLARCRRCDGLSVILQADPIVPEAWRKIGVHTCQDHELWPTTLDEGLLSLGAGARFEFGETPERRHIR